MSIQSISNVLLKPTEKLTIKLSVSLLTKEGTNGYYNIYEKGRNGYMVVDTSSTIRLEYKGDKDEEWSRDQWVYINSKNIYQLIQGLDEVKEIFDNEKMFRVNSMHELEMIPIDERHIVVIDNLGNGQCLKFVPSVVYDRNEKDLMGMYMFINNSTRAVDLSIDEFESIWYLFKNLNLRLETQSLINLSLLEQLKAGVGNSTLVTNNNIDETKQQLKHHLKSSGATSIFDLANKKDNITKEKVEGGRLPSKQPTSLDEL